jgi:hypothetical protein
MHVVIRVDVDRKTGAMRDDAREQHRIRRQVDSGRDLAVARSPPIPAIRRIENAPFTVELDLDDGVHAECRVLALYRIALRAGIR